MPRARLAAILLAAFVWARAQAPDTAPGKCRVSGQVVHFTAGTPVHKVTVKLKRFGSEAGASNSGSGREAPTVSNYATTSDDRGRFVFDSVEPGVYWLFADRVGYMEQAFGAREPLLKGTPLKLAAGERRDGLTIKLTPQSLVYGKVADQDGDILPNAQVQVYKPGWTQGRKRLTAVASAVSQDDGSFVVGNLQAGRYYLSATQPAGDLQGDDPSQHSTYATTYYPSVTDPASASAVDIAAGAEVRGLEIRLRQARAFHIRGKAINTVSGGPAAQTYLKLTTTDGAKEPDSMEVGAMTGADGTFDFPNVGPGSYVIATSSQAFGTSFVVTSPGEIPTPVKSGAASLIGRAMVEVGEQDLDNVVVSLSEGVVVSGSVRMDREDPGKPSPWPGLTLAPVDGQGEESIVAQVKPDGSFRIPHIPPDGYSLQVTGLPDDVYVKWIRFEGHEIAAEDLNLTSGAGGQLEIVLSPNAAAISGVVRDAQGDTAAGATVQVCSGDDTVKYVSADQNGEYRVGGLPPGDYRVLAWEEVDPGLSFDAAFRAHFEPQIASVKLGERAHSTVEVKMIPREAIESEAAKLK